MKFDFGVAKVALASNEWSVADFVVLWVAGLWLVYERKRAPCVRWRTFVYVFKVCLCIAIAHWCQFVWSWCGRVGHSLGRPQGTLPAGPVATTCRWYAVFPSRQQTNMQRANKERKRMNEETKQAKRTSQITDHLWVADHIMVTKANISLVLYRWLLACCIGCW